GGLERAGVERKQRRPLLDFLPFREVNLAQLPSDLSPNLDRGERFSGANGRDRHRDRFGDRVRRDNGDWSTATAATGASTAAAGAPTATGGCLRRGLLRIGPRSLRTGSARKTGQNETDQREPGSSGWGEGQTGSYGHAKTDDIILYC